MSGLAWSLVDVVSQLLDREEREAVQGDLAEAGEGAWQGLLEVAGLIVRRQLLLWKSWQPWLATFGVALPSTLLLMGVSVSVSHRWQRIATPSGFPLLLCSLFLLIGWAWAGGFVVGFVSRRTVWVSALFASFPCLFCLMRFREPALSRFCLFLFVLPALWGARQGLRSTAIRLRPALVLAVALTALTISTGGGKGPWWVLTWPAWFMVATARKPG